jgi:hypothetical protein
LRHAFVLRLAENPAESEEAIFALAGHVSQQMLRRYSHIGTHAKEAATAGPENHAIEAPETVEGGERAQNWAQLATARLN